MARSGSCAGLVITLTIIHDYYYQEQARRILPYVAASFAIVPGLAVSLGGALVQYLGWSACFYFLAFYYFVAFILVFQLPETAMTFDPTATHWGKVFRNYYNALNHLPLLLYGSMVAAFAAIIYVYSTNAPLIADVNFNFTPAHFGLINLIPFLGYLLGNLVNSRISQYLSGRGSILLGGIILLVLTSLLWFTYVQGMLNSWVFFTLMTLVLFDIPFIWSNAAVLSAASYPDGSSANAVLGFLNVGGAIIGVLFSSLFNQNLLLTTLVTFAIICIIIFGLYMATSRYGAAQLKG